MNKIETWIEQSLKKITRFCSTPELNGLKSRLYSKCDKEFSRGVSELVVSRHYAETYPQELLIPRGTKKDKDIDLSFTVAGLRINVEVKCPDLSSDTSKTFTLRAPYIYPNFKKGKEIERELPILMGNNINVIPNKVLNFDDFLNDCSSKFKQSSDINDFNVVVFSMQNIEWMDDYRVKIEDEHKLNSHKLIDMVVISNAASTHSRSEDTTKLGFNNCFNYIIFNSGARNQITIEEKKEILTFFPNQTTQSMAWYKDLIKNDCPIGVSVKSIQRLALYSKIILAARDKSEKQT